MPNTFTILGPSPAPPMVWDEITLCFDSDRPAGDLLKIIPLRPTELVSRSETRFNPLEHCQNPGFWTYKTEKSQSFDTEPLFRQLADMLRRHERAFRQALQNVRTALCGGPAAGRFSGHSHPAGIERHSGRPGGHAGRSRRGRQRCHQPVD